MTTAKKIFITSSIILGILLIFLGIYQLNFSSNTPSNTKTNQTNNNSGNATNSNDQSGFGVISDKKVAYPFIDFSSSHIQYYSLDTQLISQMNIDGTGGTILWPKNVVDPKGIFWSPNGSKAIIKSNQGDYSLYDRDKNSQTSLKTIDTIYWQNTNKIFYKFYDPQTQERTLNIANPDGSDWLKIADIDFKHADIAPVPKSGLVSVWNTQDALQETKLIIFPIVSGNGKNIFQGKFGADYLWSSNGNNILISHSDQKGGSKIQLAVVNSQGGEYKNLNIATFVSKCVWLNNNEDVFCAVPESLPENNVLPNDYNSGKIHTKDDFFKINTKTGEKTSLINPVKILTDVDASDLNIDSQNNTLIFLNKNNNKLYKLNLQ